MHGETVKFSGIFVNMIFEYYIHTCTCIFRNQPQKIEFISMGSKNVYY